MICRADTKRSINYLQWIQSEPNGVQSRRIPVTLQPCPIANYEMRYRLAITKRDRERERKTPKNQKPPIPKIGSKTECLLSFHLPPYRKGAIYSQPKEKCSARLRWLHIQQKINPSKWSYDMEMFGCIEKSLPSRLYNEKQ